jgi:flagellar M-ring protein FliF
VSPPPPSALQTSAGANLATAGSLAPVATEVSARPTLLTQIRTNPRIPAMIAAAVAVALLAMLLLWSRTPDYKVLYSNLSDRDGGDIITALQTLNVPYKFADGGGAILVPADAVHEARLRLAQQGLPKGGSVGFELMDSQKFGISEFAEQVNYQRALEGELERTIASIASVQSARVHLAIPKPSVFVRDQQKPSASVLVNMYQGRSLDDGQVSAITHMVSSGVPQMSPKDVTVVDQNGNLLTTSNAGSSLDANQLKYVQQVELNTKQRIEAILAPLYGPGNAHAQISADLDFSRVEQTAEDYQPNQKPANAAIRSQQTSVSNDPLGMGGAGGVPGALSNQPPQPASAPLSNPPANPDAASAPAGASGAAARSVAMSTHRDETTNYEVDKTIRHIEQPVGSIKRLSAAVVINYRRQLDAKGKPTMQPLTADQLKQTEALIKDAMGFDQQRGDTLNVVNSTFSASDPNSVAAVPDLPLWKQPDMIDMAKTGGKYLLIGIAALYLFFAVLRPSVRRALKPPELPAPVLPQLATEPAAAEAPLVNLQTPAYERNLALARTIAKQDPKIVANVVKSWVSDER